MCQFGTQSYLEPKLSLEFKNLDIKIFGVTIQSQAYFQQITWMGLDIESPSFDQFAFP